MKVPHYISRPKFLAELKRLYEKYDIVISSCECCGGTHLTSLLDDADYHIKHLADNDLRLDDPHST